MRSPPENSLPRSGTTGPAAAPARPSSSPSSRLPASGPQGSGAAPATGRREIRETLDLALYRDDVEIVTPDDQIIKLKADQGRPGPNRPRLSPRRLPSERPSLGGLWPSQVPARPGLAGKLLAYNVPPQESRLELISDDQLRKHSAMWSSRFKPPVLVTGSAASLPARMSAGGFCGG